VYLGSYERVTRTVRRYQKRSPGCAESRTTTLRRPRLGVTETNERITFRRPQGLVHRDIKPANVWLEEGPGMKRIHFIEIGDQPWWPRGIRRGVTDFCRFAR